MSKPHSHIPYGSDGSGYYSEHTVGCYDVIEQTKPAALECIESIPFTKDEGAFTICDYGTADGGISLYLLSDCIGSIKERYGENQEVQVIYEDQPVNDFKSIFMRVHGLMSGPPSYYQRYKNVFVTASGTSFYSQVVPSNTVHLGYSSTALHWLSESPGTLEGAMHHVCAQNEAQKRIFAEHAARDWETILLHRAKELKRGGRMCIACLCVDKKGNYLGNSPHSKHSMYEQMIECWTELMDEGTISKDEQSALQENSYYRTEEEFQAPFRPDRPVYEAGLRLVSYETREVRCPYHSRWVADNKTGDVKAARTHAQTFIQDLRAWSNSTFVSALCDRRTANQKSQIVDGFFQKYEDRIAAAPGDHSMEYYHAYLVIEKV